MERKRRSFHSDAGEQMKIVKGIILSVVAGYYFVEAQGRTILCRGRGKLRQGGISPLAGDNVEISIGEGQEGSVERILPRRNQLRRPAVANVDAVLMVIAPQDPSPDLGMVDRLLAVLALQGIQGIICVNKSDLDWDKAQELAAIYADAGYTTVICSAQTGDAMDDLNRIIGDQIVVLAGQSGVGKSEITAAIAVGELDIPIQIGSISAKIGRGKHTTRQVSLLPLAGGGKVADTPGFSILELDMDSRELHRVYPEFVRLAQGCQFSPCLHIHEPVCAVKEHLARGEINPQRYDNYLSIYQELKEKEAKRY